jgi:hypothetical protein
VCSRAWGIEALQTLALVSVTQIIHHYLVYGLLFKSLSTKHLGLESAMIRVRYQILVRKENVLTIKLT